MVGLIRQSDYENYDYRQFWQDNKRDYEDKSERLAVRKLLGRIETEGKIFIDLGCGFGRLFNEYRNFKKIILVDYSFSNIKNARDSITKFLNRDFKKLQDVYFIVADINNLPFKSEIADAVLTVPVIHHLLEPDIFFREVARIIKNGGCFILEYANKRNMKNILKFLSGIIRQSPFNSLPFKVGDTILNFHPAFIRQILESIGFEVLKEISVSNFRLAVLKKIAGLKFLLM
ncbi:MAG: class I SAM-dependent methyltransferase, partial [Actinobacteria bacterium]|nr:class I SAM-dependent methyltransferase [Actinomycetota bacterium]